MVLSNTTNISHNNWKRNVIFFSRTSDYLINTIYVLATVVNLVANTIICIAVRRNPKLRNPVNCLLVNLSIANILSAVGIYPYIFIVDILKITMSDSGLKVACSLSDGGHIFFIGSGVSLLTLSTVSLTRYLVIRFPMRPEFRMSKRGAKLYIAICWIISIASLIPSAQAYKYSYTLCACVRDWGEINGVLYRFALLFFTLLVPSNLLIFCYAAIATAKKTHIPGLSEAAHLARLQTMKKAENLVRLLMVNYLTCWLPFIVYWILATFTHYFQPTYDGQTLKLRWIRVTTLFATFNGTIDPFLYIPPNKDLKKEVKRILWWAIPVRTREHRTTFSDQTKSTVIKLVTMRSSQVHLHQS